MERASILGNVRQKLRKLIVTNKWQKELSNRNPSIFSNDCTAGVLLHDLSCQFRSPTVNMYFPPKDYLRFLEQPEKYLNGKILPVESGGYGYPIGRIDDVVIHLVHYNTIEEAQTKWDVRSKRIDWDNLFVIMNDRNGCEYADLERFERLPYKRKLLLTHKHYPDLSSAFYMERFAKLNEVAVLTEFRSRFSIHRNLDDFNWVAWLNNEQ